MSALCTRCDGLDRNLRPCDPTVVAIVHSEELNMPVCRTCAGYAAERIEMEKRGAPGGMWIEMLDNLTTLA